METKGKNSLYSLAMSHLTGQSLVVVKESLVRSPTTALLLWGNFSRDRLLQKANCFITSSTRWQFFFSRDLFADVMSMHNRNTKHAHATEFDWTNLLAML